MPMNEKRAVRVKGGAGPSEAAAIAAVIQKVIDDERAAGAQPTGRRALTDWVAAGRGEAGARPQANIALIARPARPKGVRG